MTQKLQGALGCKACQLSLSYRLREPDTEGCNWSSAILRCGYDDPTLQHAKQIASGIVEQARQMFNLADELDAINPLKASMDMTFERRLLYIPVFHIDTNLINAKQKLDEVNRLECWAKNDVILINMSWTAHSEARAGGNSHRAKKAARQIYTIDTGDIDAELITQVGNALFPGGPQDENQRNDVRIVCEAAKYQATLVTNDGASKSQPGGILGNRDKLQVIDGIKILSPTEAVELVKSKIKERDDFNKRVAEESGKTLPDWTGMD